MRIVYLGLDPDFVDYEWAWERQRELHAKVVEGLEPDTVLLLEHRPVYTAGKRTEPHERPRDGTPASGMPHGMITSAHASDGLQLSANPCMATWRLTRMPMAPTLRLGRCRGSAGSARIHVPDWPGTRPATTPKSAHTRIIISSSARPGVPAVPKTSLPAVA